MLYDIAAAMPAFRYADDAIRISPFRRLLAIGAADNTLIFAIDIAALLRFLRHADAFFRCRR